MQTSETIRELVPKKRGKLLIIGKNLDKQVREYLLETRRWGEPVNTMVAIAAGTGIVISHDPSLLIGDKSIMLTKGWVKYLLNRMGFVKRKCTTKVKVDVAEFKDTKKLFLLDVKNVVQMDEICSEMIVNWDQIGINYVPVSSWAMEEEGSRRVNLDIKVVIIPYFENKRQKLKLEADNHGLVLFDNFNGQCTDGIFQLLEEHHINSVIIPANCTDHLQPLDLSFNKAAKTFLHSKFQMWFAKEIALQKDSEKPREPVDLRLSNMKPLGAQWLVKLYDHFKANPTVLLNGFRAAGITNCLNA